MDTSPSLALPRIRLIRHSPRLNDEPIAGPSRLSPDAHDTDDDEDAESTPRMTTSAQIHPENPSQSFAQPLLPGDTPAARLRALLARVPNSPATPHVSSFRSYVPPSPSEPDSDFDPPNDSSSPTPSFARESLKQLFSRALRDPGDTPQKVRARRNSLGASEADESPRVESVQRERAKNKGKRSSMSDEEAEKLSKTSESSFRAPSAATFDALRERLNKSAGIPPPEQFVSDMSDDPEGTSRDTVTMFPQLTASISMPPDATSTPMRTLQISGLQLESNLMEQDSSMHRAMGTVESSEGEPTTPQRPVSFPPARPRSRPSPSASRPLSWTSHSKSHSTHKIPLVRREDIPSPRVEIDYNDKDRERERGWNQAHSKSPALYDTSERTRRQSLSSPSRYGVLNGRGSPRVISRRASGTSVQSTDDGRSSRGSSMMSRSDYQDRIQETEQDRNKERERLWNKHRPSPPGSSSSLSVHSSSEHLPSPNSHRPGSEQSMRSREYTPLHRHSSAGSLGSRADSPTGSLASRDSDKNTEPEVRQLRERNWNAPQPTWSAQRVDAKRPISPLSHSPSPSRQRIRTTSLGEYGNRDLLQSYNERSNENSGARVSLLPRAKNGSLAEYKSLSPAQSPSPGAERSPRPRGKLTGPANVRDKLSSRPQSPSPHSSTEDKAGKASPASPGQRGDSAMSTGFGSRFGWQYPRNRTQLPPLEFEDSPERPPAAQLPNGFSGENNRSHIPVRSPGKYMNGSSISAVDNARGQRRKSTERSDAKGADRPRTSMVFQAESENENLLRETEPLAGSDLDSDGSPATRPVSPLSEVQRNIPQSPHRTNNTGGNSDRLNQTPTKQESPITARKELSSSPVSTLLQTPPRRSLFHTPKSEFKTPSPPRGLPDLPELPFSSDDDVDTEEDEKPLERTNGYINGDLTAMKTPRPPGAWAATPVPSRGDVKVKEPLVRASSMPESPDATSEYEVPTPRGSLSRASSLPLQTPAPPGAWAATPMGSLRRKSILKVRFDVESENASSDGPSGTVPNEQHDQNSLSSDPTYEHIHESPVSINAGEIQERPSTPTQKNPYQVTRRSPSSIRLVDAFGRETKDEVAEGTDDLKVEDEAALISTPRNKSGVRIVDAMGREVEDVGEVSFASSEESLEAPKSHNEALARVRQTVAHMREDLSEADRSNDDFSDDPHRLSDLNNASKAARNARSKLSKSLQLVKNTGDDLKSKYGPLRESMLRSQVVSNNIIDGPVTVSRLSTRMFWTLLFLIQLFLIFLMCRLSTIRAKHIFLSTYSDPFYPDIYTHITKPDTVYRSIPYPSQPWSIFSVLETAYRVGWTGAAEELWGHMTCMIMTCQRRAWETWDAGQTISWPPT